MRYVLFETFKTFQTHWGGGGLLIWNFQMRLEMRSAIWNFSNTNQGRDVLLIWNFQMRLEMRSAIWNFWNFSVFNPSEELLIWIWDMKWDLLFETFKVFNPSQWLPIPNFQMRLETVYMLFDLECLKLFKHITGLEKDVIFETFETSNFSTHHRGCLFETFRWNLTLFKHIMRGLAYLKLSDENWDEMCYLKLLKPETFQSFQPIRTCLFEYETWNEMCYFKLFKLFNP